MTTTEPERRYFQNVRDSYVCPVVQEYAADYAASPHYREVLIVPVPEVEISEPDTYGDRWAHFGDGRYRYFSSRDAAADWRERRDRRITEVGESEVIARWIEENSGSVARVQAARAVLATLTDDERAEALR